MAVVLSLNKSICGKMSVYAFLVRCPVVRKTAVKRPGGEGAGGEVSCGKMSGIHSK